MEYLKIEIINPNALALLENLAKLDLIKLKRENKLSFSKVLKKIRAKNDNKLTIDDINFEVEEVRASRYGKK